jgi:hypothetical protein
MKHTATIFMRGGGVWCTEMTVEENGQIDTASLGRRISDGGFIVCSDKRWGKQRTIVINASDVSTIEIVQNEQQ